MSVELGDFTITENFGYHSLLTIVIYWHCANDTLLYAKQLSANMKIEMIDPSLVLIAQCDLLKSDFEKNNFNNVGKIKISIATWFITTSQKTFYFNFEGYEDINILFQTMKESLLQIKDQIVIVES